MSHLRIAVFGDVRPQRINGFATSLTTLTRSLRAAGHRADLFSTTLDDGADNVEVTGVAVGNAGLATLGDYDVAILTGCFDPRLWHVALRCKRASLPYVVSPRSSLMRQSWRTSFFKKLLCWPVLRFWYFRGRVAVHFLSEEERNNSWGGFQRRWFAVPNALSIPIAAMPPPKADVIGFLGRLDVRHKGLDTLVEAAAHIAPQLRAAGFRVELVGPDHRGGAAWLDDRVARLGLADIVSVLPARRGADKLDWLGRTSIFVHASRYEGQPQAVFEAIAQGALPIVTHQCNMDAVIARLGVGAAVDGTAESVAGAVLAAISARAEPDMQRLKLLLEDYSEAAIATRMAAALHAFITEVTTA